MSDWLTVGGSIASILGAAFSWIQADKAKDYADGISDGKKVVKQQNDLNVLAEFTLLTRQTSIDLSSEYIKKKKASEIQSIIDPYLTEFSSFLGKIPDNSHGRLPSYRDSISNRCLELKDDNDLAKNVGNIKHFVDHVLTEVSKMKTDSLFR